MTRQSLEMLQKIAVYGGVIITLVGIAITFSSDMVGGCVALVGVAITCLGLVADYQLSKHQAAEKAADDARIADLEERLWQAEEITQDPALRMAVDDHAARYADEHQDDGR